MNLNNCVILQINGFGYKDKCFLTKETFIEHINNKGIKHLDIYCIIKDIKMKEKYKTKLHIQSNLEFVFNYISDEEWEKYRLR